MKRNRMADVINKHIQGNFWLYLISMLCISTGIIVGIYTVSYMGGFEKTDLNNYLTSFGTAMQSGQISGQAIFIETLKNNIPILAAVWFLGLTMIGIPMILIVDILKGFTIGFTTSFIINGLGTKGIFMTFIGILPQNIIYVPCVLISSVFAMEFSMTLIKEKIYRQWNSHIFMRITSYCITFLILTAVMLLGFIIESYITPNVVKLIVSNTGRLMM